MPLFYPYAELMCDETLVERIAQMANYFLNLLVGKKRKTLKVKNKKRLQFQPTKLVSSLGNSCFLFQITEARILAELYISLGDNDRWRDAVVRDERSFSVDLIKATHQVLSKSGIILTFDILLGFEEFPSKNIVKINKSNSKRPSCSSFILRSY